MALSLSLSLSISLFATLRTQIVYDLRCSYHLAVLMCRKSPETPNKETFESLRSFPPTTIPSDASWNNSCDDIGNSNN